MGEQSNGFEGYMRAKVEDIARVQGEQRLELQFLRAQISELAVAVGALRATARAWGIFAGILSGAFSGLAAKFWKL